jgi:hypothetical protein
MASKTMLDESGGGEVVGGGLGSPNAKGPCARGECGRITHKRHSSLPQ